MRELVLLQRWAGETMPGGSLCATTPGSGGAVGTVSCANCSSCLRASPSKTRPAATSALPRCPRGRATFSHSTSTSSPVSPFSSLNCAAAARWPLPSQRSAAASRTIGSAGARAWRHSRAAASSAGGHFQRTTRAAYLHESQTHTSSLLSGQQQQDRLHHAGRRIKHADASQTNYGDTEVRYCSATCSSWHSQKFPRCLPKHRHHAALCVVGRAVLSAGSAPPPCCRSA